MAWGTQRDWRWCSKCQGLFLGPNEPQSACPRGGAHTGSESDNYSLVHGAVPTPPNHQADWRWCNKCQGLWFGPNAAQSTCPKGGRHVQTGSGNYALAHEIGAGQENWRWCSKCQGLWFGPNQGESECLAGDEHTLSGSGNYRIPSVSSRIRVHVKILTPPDIAVETLFQNTREVFAAQSVDVEWASTETLNLPALNIVDAGECNMGVTTAEQDELFENRNSADETDIVVYFVQATNPPYNGCAAHPARIPGAVAVRTASAWTFAHEIGHVLGLRHVDDNDRLMTRNGTANITNPPPDLVDSEGATMQASALTVDV